MSDGLDDLGEDTGIIADINIDAKGVVLPQKTDKIALIDADTVVFSSCTVLEQVEELLPISFYTDEEWKEIQENPGYKEQDHTLSFINMEEAIIHAEDKIDFILERTGCKDFELHFTVGRQSFPYTMVDKEYKGNRDGKPTPYGLMALKEDMAYKYPQHAFLHTKWEADHIVVCKKRDNYDKYVLCAVDKDVLKGLAGDMFNYYQSTIYNIDMKWIHNTEEEAMKRYYHQTLTGDTGDNVIGLHGIGDAKATKALKDCTTDSECWDKVVEMYETNGRTIVEAITNMRLVDMRQLELVDGKYEVKLWRPE